MMRYPLRTMTGVALAAALVTSGSASLRAASRPVAPSPAISFKMHDAGGGVGYQWGHGHLTFHGKTYTFRVSGAGVGTLGYETVEAVGHVDDMAELADFNGSYWTARADAAVWKGGGYAVLENQHGVHLLVHMTAHGAHLGASILKLAFTLQPDPSAAAAK